jgi:hypothetical protein
MIPLTQLQQYAREIHANRNLWGCPIGYYGAYQCQLVDAGIAGSVNITRVAAIIEEVDEPASPGVRIQEAQTARSPARPAAPPTASTMYPNQTNGSRTFAELSGAGLTCIFTVISVRDAARTAGPPAILGWAGAAAQYVQCMNSIGRALVAVTDPNSNSLALMDGESGSQLNIAMAGVSAFSDVISMMQIGTAGAQLRNLLATRGGLNVSSFAHAPVARQEEMWLNAIGHIMTTPEGREEMRHALQRAGASRAMRETLLRGFATSSRHAADLSRPVISLAEATVMSGRINEAFRLVRELTVGAVALAADASPGIMTGGASGVLNQYVVSPLIHLFHQSAN